jgi:hypothetical protein
MVLARRGSGHAVPPRVVIVAGIDRRVASTLTSSGSGEVGFGDINPFVALLTGK